MNGQVSAPAPPPPAPPAPAPGLEAFLDVSVRLTIEIGRLEIRLGDLLRMKPGSVFPTAKPAGDPFEVAANGQPVARGEVVAAGDSGSGVRITEVIAL